MTGQFSHLRQWRVFPQQNLILAVSVGRHQFAGMLRPGKIAHLWFGVNALKRLLGQRVPKPNTSVKSNLHLWKNAPTKINNNSFAISHLVKHKASFKTLEDQFKSFVTSGWSKPWFKNQTRFFYIFKEEAWRMFHLHRHFEIKRKKTNPKP